MADRYLLESGSPDGYLLEDGSGVLLLDSNPASSTLTDNFDDNSTDVAKWSVAGWRISTTTSGGTISEANQRLECTAATSATDKGAGYVSAAAYDLTGGSFYVKPTLATAIDANQEFFLAAGPNSSNYVRMVYFSGTLYFQKVVAEVFTTLSSVGYVGATHTWWRIRHGGAGDDTIYYDTAPSTATDPPSSGDWVNQTSAARDLAITVTNAKAAIQLVATASTASPATVYFDGFNTATVGTVTHATTGVVTGPGSTIAGTAAHIAIHTTTGVLTGAGSTIAGAAVYNAKHTSTGALTGAGSSIVGSAARTREHATTGILTGPGSTIVGVAVYNAKHATSGILAGQGSTIVGSATRFRAHATTGAITGPGSVIVGVAVYNAKHTTSGALTGPGSTLAGSATRFRTFATSGALVGSGSTIAGAALRGIISITHATSGALIGQPSIIDGTAKRTRQHATSGVLTGPQAFIVGVVTRWRDHDSSGALLGVTGIVFGRAFNGTPQLHDIPVDSDNLVNEPSPPPQEIGAITKPSGQIVNHPPYPPA